MNKTVYKPNGDPLTYYDIELDNAIIQVKKGGGKYTPMTTSAAYNSKTGKAFLGHRGMEGFNPSRLDKIHPELQKRVDAVSKAAKDAGKSTRDGIRLLKVGRLKIVLNLMPLIKHYMMELVLMIYILRQ